MNHFGINFPVFRVPRPDAFTRFQEGSEAGKNSPLCTPQLHFLTQNLYLLLLIYISKPNIHISLAGNRRALPEG